VGSAGGGDNDVVMETLAGIYLAQFAIAALAVMAIGSEYATGLIRVTFVADPRRRTVLAAKALVVGAAALAAGLAAAAASYLIGRPLLADGGFTGPGYPELALTEGAVPRAVIGTGLYLASVALLSLGVGAIVRHTAAAITLVIALLFVPLIAASLLPGNLSDQVLRFSPMTAGLAIQRTVDRADSVPIGEWAGLGVAALWAAGALAVALWLIGRRDA
jgi:ABC-type transport system involved in multi-copper enzyme maturation permease subunit